MTRPPLTNEGELVEVVARAISGAAYDYMRSIGFSGGWDHDELGRAIARAALEAASLVTKGPLTIQSEDERND